MSEAIHSFRNSTAAGPDGLRALYLKEMLCSAQGRDHQQLLERLTEVSNLLLRGSVPQEIRPILYGANLFAFGKKDGGLRPIAVGLTLRRLVAKAICKRLQGLSEEMRPFQLGFATPRGVEAAVHATRSFIEKSQGGPTTTIIIKLDVKNAFNSIDREALLHAVKEKMIGYYPLIAQAYGAPSFLLYGDEVIMSEKGLQQGDPFGPLSYCLTTVPIHLGLKSAMVQSYLDDDILRGAPEDVLSDFITLRSRSAEIGLDFNLNKCEIAAFGGTAAERERAIQSFLTEFPELQQPENR